MKYEINLKMENGKIKSVVSADIEILGFKFKIKDQEVEGDINETLELLTKVIEGGEKDLTIFAVEAWTKTLGIKKPIVDKLKTALKSKMR